MAKKKKATAPAKAKTIPAGDAEFHLFQLNFMTLVMKFMLKWGLDQAFINDTVTPAKEEWNHSWAAYQNPHTRTEDITARKKLARKVYEKYLRILVGIIKLLPTVSDLEREEAGIVPDSPSSKKPAVIKATPSLTFDLDTIRRILVGFGAKPVDVHGLEILVKVGGAKPEKIEEFHHSYFVTRTPYELVFDEDQRFIVVYIIARYEGTVGQKGPWSVIYTVVIP
jgi:hypothetical protein